MPCHQRFGAQICAKKTKSTWQLHAQNRFRAGLFHRGAGEIRLFCVKFKFFSHKNFALPFWFEFYLKI